MINSICTLLTVLFSGITLVILVFERIQRCKCERMCLIVTPKAKVPNSKDGFLYLLLAFSNESTLPISIIDLQIDTSSYGTGLVTPFPVNVLESDRMDPVIVKDYKTLSSTVPFTMQPLSTFSGFFAFNVSDQVSFTLCYKTVKLFITTSRKTYKVTFELYADNFYDMSIRDDGLMLGRAVFGKSYQDTKIQPNELP